MNNLDQIIVESKKPQITLFLDSSVMNTFEKCPELMNLQYLRNYRFKGGKSKALEKGDLIHIPLKHYYRNKKKGMEWEANVHFSWERLQKYSTTLSLDAKEVEEISTAFLSYCEFYRWEKWTVVETEKPFRLIIFEDEELRIVYQGKIDLIVDTGQLIIPVDHKSESRKNEAIALSNQFMGYTYATERNNIIINKIGLQKSLKSEEKFYRTMLSYHDDNLIEWRDEFVFKVREMLGYAEINHFPHRYTSCQDKYGLCQFHSVCHTPRVAREVKLNSQFEVVEPWNPFVDLEDEENSNEKTN